MGKADDCVGGIDTDPDDIGRRLVEVVHETIIFVLTDKCEKIIGKNRKSGARKKASRNTSSKNLGA